MKRDKYEERVKKVEHGNLTPLVSSVFGGLGKAALAVISRTMALRNESKGLVWEAGKVGREIFIEKSKMQLAVLRSVSDSMRGRPEGVELPKMVPEGRERWEGRRLDGQAAVDQSPEDDVAWVGSFF